MAIKPLKLKRYISEDEAAQLLSLLIDEEVSSKDIATYALAGVVPAYIEFQRQACGDGFYMLDRDDANNPEMLNIKRGGSWWLDILPYPLPRNGWLVDSYGTEWKPFAAGDNESFEPVEAESYPRVYAPQEVCQVAQILNDPASCPEWPAVIHTHGPSWTYADENSDENGPIHILSPYDDAIAYQIQAAQSSLSGQPKVANEERRINWPLVVAGMWEELKEVQKTQERLADKIGERAWKGARTDDIKHALRIAKKAKAALEQ